MMETGPEVDTGMYGVRPTKGIREEMLGVHPHPLPPLTLPRRCKQTTTDKEQDRAAAGVEGREAEGEDPDVECEYMPSELVPMLK